MTPSKQAGGSIEVLPSGALRSRSVYTRVDLLTGRRHHLCEVIPSGPEAAAEADEAVRRLAGRSARGTGAAGRAGVNDDVPPCKRLVDD